MKSINANGHMAGFTVTELVVVMLVVAILAAIAVPSFKYVTTSNRLAGEINGLLGDMQFARSEAIKQGLPVTVCSSGGGTSCANSHWQNGWIVFLDSNGSQQVDAGETIIRSRPSFSANGDTLQPFNNITFSAITFNREGYATLNTGNAATPVTLLLHDSTAQSQWTRCLYITPVGMLSTQRPPTGNCS